VQQEAAGQRRLLVRSACTAGLGWPEARAAGVVHATHMHGFPLAHLASIWHPSCPCCRHCERCNGDFEPEYRYMLNMTVGGARMWLVGNGTMVASMFQVCSD